MQYCDDVWLEILSRADPISVCRFSRTCWRAKCLIDRRINFLPTAEMRAEFERTTGDEWLCGYAILDRSRERRPPFELVSYSTGPTLSSVVNKVKCRYVREVYWYIYEERDLSDEYIGGVMEAIQLVDAEAFTCVVACQDFAVLYQRASKRVLLNELPALKRASAVFLQGSFPENWRDVLQNVCMSRCGFFYFFQPSASVAEVVAFLEMCAEQRFRWSISVLEWVSNIWVSNEESYVDWSLFGRFFSHLADGLRESDVLRILNVSLSENNIAIASRDNNFLCKIQQLGLHLFQIKVGFRCSWKTLEYEDFYDIFYNLVV